MKKKKQLKNQKKNCKRKQKIKKQGLKELEP